MPPQHLRMVLGNRQRFVRGFPVNSGVFIGEVKSFGLLDFYASIDLPESTGMQVILTVQNVLNNKHKEFVGAPEIGRLALINLKYFPERNKN